MKKIKEKLVKGIQVNHSILYAKRIAKGRFVEEANLILYLKEEDKEVYLLSAKVFHGRMPVYQPWVELFNIHNSISLGRRIVNYFDSALEDELLSLFAQFLEPRGNIYFEYYNDIETEKQLKIGVPPPVTRLGYKLFKLGFTWFKDWYFPEGFIEGGQKLQGEKSPNDEIRNRQLKEIYGDLQTFLDRIEKGKEHDYLVARALKRATIILGERRLFEKKPKVEEEMLEGQN